MNNSAKGWKFFAIGVAVSVAGAILADVVRDQYRKYKAVK